MTPASKGCTLCHDLELVRFPPGRLPDKFQPFCTVCGRELEAVELGRDEARWRALRTAE
jgi:hypothetical protein